MWVLSIDGKAATSLLTAVTLIARQAKQGDASSWIVIAIPPTVGIEIIVSDRRQSLSEEQAKVLILALVGSTNEGSFQL